VTTVETIQKLKFELLPHLTYYSPDLTPSHYHIFRPLKYTLHGCHSADHEEVKDMVHVWFHMQPKTFFTNSIRKLVDQSEKYMEKLGDYFGKMTIYLFLGTVCRINKIISCTDLLIPFMD
jgi:hypothetical protein